VAVTPEESKINVFKSGTSLDSNGNTLIGGHEILNSIVGDRLV
jgi:hypothetical protein